MSGAIQGKDYIVIVQCHLVKQRCSGYCCEANFRQRKGGFADYARDKDYRTLYMTCGGCCGKATLRKLNQLTKSLDKRESIPKDRVVVQLSSCMTKDNYHSPPCPHLAYIKELVARAGLDCREDTAISETAEKRRQQGGYSS